MRPCSPRLRRDRGSVTIETVIMAPVFGAFLALIIVAGRIHNSRLDLDAAASQAARAISLSDDPWGAGMAEARTIAREVVREGGPTCRVMDLDAAPGDPIAGVETVEVSITCLADLSGLSALPVPGAVEVDSAPMVEVFDRFTEGP